MSEAAEGGAGEVRAVHQFVPALIPRDATGSHTLLLRDALRRAGWRSEIFAEATHDELKGQSIPVGEYPARSRPGDVLVYQFSTSSAVADLLAGRPEPLVLNYHNITDPRHSGSWDRPGAARSAQARQQLAVLAPRAVLGIADSAFNARDLVAAGCRATAVVPVLVDFDRVEAAPDPWVAARLAEGKEAGGADWLFVGRLVPSKGQHQLVKALWAARRTFDPRARLHLVGAAPARRYLMALREFVTELGLDEAVHLSGEVRDAALLAYYGAADVYVSLSEHEGFGVPLVEAMRARVPVLALGAGAVPDTVGGAGLLLDRATPLYVAAAVDRVLGDQALRRRLVAAGADRAASFSLAAAAGQAVRAIARVAGDPPAAGQLPVARATAGESA